MKPATLSELLERLHRDLAERFQQSVEALEARANAADEHAQARLSEMDERSVAVLLELGSVRRYAFLKERALQFESSIEGVDAPICFAFSLPEDTIEPLIDALRQAAPASESIDQIYLTSLRDTEALFQTHPIRMHLTVQDIPGAGTSTFFIGLGVSEVPKNPEFTATVSYDDLRELTTQGFQPQQLMMQGKVRLQGDYSAAIQLAMQWMAKQ